MVTNDGKVDEDCNSDEDKGITIVDYWQRHGFLANMQNKRVGVKIQRRAHMYPTTSSIEEEEEDLISGLVSLSKEALS